MEQVLLVVQVLLAIALIGMVLIQRSDSDGFGLSGGGSNLMSGRTAANAMTRITAILATLFIINSLALSVIAASGRAPSILSEIEQQQADGKAAPAVPVDGDTKTEKAPAAKLDEKTGAPHVPAADADGKPAATVKKLVKKVPAPVEAEANETESNE